MFAKGPIPGATPKQDALALLPKGTHCQQASAFGISGYVVTLPDGRNIASAGNSSQAWSKAHDWALKNPTFRETGSSSEGSELSKAFNILLKGTKYEKD